MLRAALCQALQQIHPMLDTGTLLRYISLVSIHCCNLNDHMSAHVAIKSVR